MTQFTCTKCNTTTSIENEISVESFGCPKCKSFYLSNRGSLQFNKEFSYKNITPTIPIGAKGTFENETYEVVGMLIKHLGSFVYAREYTLKSKSEKFLYLSECEGHWILLKEVENIPEHRVGGMKILFQNMKLNKYGYCPTQVFLISGFFDINFKVKDIDVIEYISPPYILSIETLQDTRRTYFGEHISKRKVKNIFNLKELPSTSGVGLVQPFYFNIKQTIQIFLVTILIIVSTFLFQSSGTSEQVLNTSLNVAEFKDKEYVSPSFTYNGPAAPLRVDVSTSVENSWAYTSVSVVNENTNEEIVAEQDIEYYSGYEDGESWSEGSNSEKFYICGLKSGKYHIVVSVLGQEKPQKAPFTYTDSYGNLQSVDDNLPINVSVAEQINVSAFIESPSNWNFGVCIVILTIFIIAAYVGKRFFEEARWSDSNYSLDI